jgi:hypothetical protein
LDTAAAFHTMTADTEATVIISPKVRRLIRTCLKSLLMSSSAIREQDSRNLCDILFT